MHADTFGALLEAVRTRPPVAALVLGSGLNEAIAGMTCLRTVPFGELPGMPVTTVAGHRGKLGLYEAGDRSVLVFHGRLHFYEGHSWEVVERPMRLAAELGVRTVLLTNAAGGIGPLQRGGSLMAIRDQLDAMRPGWWRRPQSSPYSPCLLQLLGQAANDAGQELPTGVYAGVTGPNYETPAEVRAYRDAGADAIGMSTVREAHIATALGMEVAGISCIANRAAGLSATHLSHADVLASVEAAGAKTGRLIRAFLARLDSRSMPTRYTPRGQVRYQPDA